MKPRFTEDSWRKEPWFRSLVSALRACKTESQLEAFLRDIGSLSELQAWSERLEIARLIGRGLSYRQVAQMTGASTTTVTRVAHVVENGEGGYRAVLRIHRHHRRKQAQASSAHTSPQKQQSTQTGSPLSEESLPTHDVDMLPSGVLDQASIQKQSSLQKYLQRKQHNEELD